MKILKLDDGDHTLLKSAKTGESFSLSCVVSAALSSKQTFIVHDKIEPGHRSSSPHRHSNIEEIVFVLKGSATLCLDQLITEVSEGTFVIFSPEDEAEHYISNKSSHTIETLTFSIHRRNDRVLK